MRIGSLCSGYAGLDMAVEDALGATTAWFCEYDRDPSAILAHHWPHVPNHGDVKATDWSQVEPVDILTAGYPCQPFSHAGKRKGSDDPRHLWPDVARAIGALRPRLVVLENVRGHVSLGLADVLGDLSGLGYDARWGVVRAADAGAPHGRARIFIVASPDTRSGSLPRTAAAGDGLPVAPQRGHLAPADASRERHGRGEDAAGVGRLDGADAGTTRERERARGVAVDRSAAAAPDTASDRRDEGWTEPAGVIGGSDAAVSGDGPVDLLPTPSAADGGGGHLTRSGDRGDELLLPGIARAYGNGGLLPTPTARDHKGHNQRQDGSCLTGALLPTHAASDATGGGRHPDARVGHTSQIIDAALLHGTAAWGKYAPAIHRWEQVTRPAPSPTEPNRNGNPRLNPAFSEWMQGWPDGWVTAVPGISRNDQLRIIGNGVVPQCASVALRWLLSVDCGVAA